jgi:glycerol-3-phosphate acyltransferase PlsY
MRFRGGKGMACLLGLTLSLNVFLTAFMLVSVLVIIIITKIYSMGSLLALIIFPFGVWYFVNTPDVAEAVLVSVFITLMLISKHRGNIRRIFKKTEPKIGRKRPS